MKLENGGHVEKKKTEEEEEEKEELMKCTVAEKSEWDRDRVDGGVILYTVSRDGYFFFFSDCFLPQSVEIHATGGGASEMNFLTADNYYAGSSST